MTFNQFKDQNYIPSLKGHPSVSRRAAYQLIHWCSSWWEPPLLSQSWESWQFWSAVEVLPSKIKSWKTKVEEIEFLPGMTSTSSRCHKSQKPLHVSTYWHLGESIIKAWLWQYPHQLNKNTWTICFIRRLFWPSQRLLVRFWNWPWRFHAEGGKKSLKWDE